MATYFVNTLYGIISIKVTCLALNHYQGGYRHYDPTCARTVQVKSANQGNEGTPSPYEPCKVGRTTVRFSYYLLALAPNRYDYDGSETIVDAVEKYKMSLDYGSDQAYCFGTRNDASALVKDKLRKWVMEFIPTWLAQHPEAWAVAEYEGQVAEHARLLSSIKEAQKEIAKLQDKAEQALAASVQMARGLGILPALEVAE